MKRIGILFLVILLGVICLASCSKDPEQTPATTYTVNWYDANGTLLTSVTLNEGATPSYTYNKADTAEWDYTVEGWSESVDGDVLGTLPPLTKDASYYAVVSRVKQTYTVTFDTEGGSLVDPLTVEYGETVSAPTENPVYDGHKFMGWSQAEDQYEEVDFTQPVTGDVTYYAVWNEVVDIKALLSELLEGYNVNPYSYIPETLLPDYSENLVDPDALISDYSSFVSVEDIIFGGFGEQWHMIADNLAQSQIFFNVLSVVEGLTTTSLATFNSYLDANPADTAQHSFESGIYTISMKFDGSVIYYVLDYTATLPVLGEQTVQIALFMDRESKDKTVRIQLGDANALTYVVTENSYEFAIRYLGVRRAFFSLERDKDGNVEGHIAEYLVVSSAEVASVADFRITDEYAYAVGNKASGLVGFTGYISEVYDVKTGHMVGYEVEETLSAITYNTLWFHLSDIGGIQSIKYVEATDTTEATFYINGASSAWESKTVGLSGGLKFASRRFDIEFRTQYFYSYDAQNDTYTEHAVKVPMLFVQEENYGTLVSDVSATNKVTISVNVTNEELDEVMVAYDTYVPVFIENKDAVTVEIILAFIGERIVFE